MIKKIFIITLCCILLISVFAGCSKKTEDVKETQAETEPIPENVDPAEFIGCWKYSDCDEWIVIKEDGTFDSYDSTEILISSKPYTATPEGLYIEVMDMTLYFDDRGVLCSDDGFEFMKSKLGQQK